MIPLRPFISRKQAASKGLTRYFTGVPCARGHLSERKVSNRSCFECRKVTGRAAWPKRKAKQSEYYKKRRQENPDELHARDRAAYYANHAACLARAAAYRARNPEKVKAAAENWRKNNQAKRTAAQRNRKALARQGGKHTADEIADILRLQRRRCGYCQIKLGKKYEVDHITALSRGGTNDRKNLQVLCVTCNQTKRAKDPIVFAQELGRLI